MILFYLALTAGIAHAQTPETKGTDEAVPASSPAASPASGSSDYEVDYEEEPAGDEEPVEEAPVKTPEKKKGGRKGPKEVAPQGSRAEKKFAPLMKSETKSIYKKNGRALDVDTD